MDTRVLRRIRCTMYYYEVLKETITLEMFLPAVDGGDWGSYER